MSAQNNDQDLLPEQTEGFKVGEKKTMDQINQLGEQSILQSWSLFGGYLNWDSGSKVSIFELKLVLEFDTFMGTFSTKEAVIDFSSGYLNTPQSWSFTA